MSYQIEFSLQARADLDDLTLREISEIFLLLFPLSKNPRPAGVQAFPLAEAADGIAYLYETDAFAIFYNIFETARVVKVVAIFRRFSWN